MGAVASSTARRGGGTALGDLPESCVAEVMLRLNPTEICGMARLSRTFRGAASGDGLWEAKLPRNYARLLAAAGEGGGNEEAAALEAEAIPKKEVYARLCRRNGLDGGTKEFWLDKAGGGTCMTIYSRALSITGIDDRRYWNFIPNDESRFRSVAYLSQIWWFEVRGEVEFCFPEGVWIYHHVGDFVVKNSNEPLNIQFAMVQIDCTHTKGGLCVDSVVVRPQYLARKKGPRGYE
uniref:Uncharacterized protein n=1 Tax=Avena sativa TaxID=4498 RepID=A0ACD5YFT4_AVESA